MLICFMLVFGMLPQMKAAAASLPGDQSSSIPSNPVMGLAYGNGTFVGVGYYGTILRSDDGLQWEQTADKSRLDVIYTSVAYGNGLFVAVGYEGTIMTSPDGRNWTQQASPVNTRIAKVDYVAVNGINKFYAVTAGGKLLASTDGAAWTASNVGNSDLTAIASNGSVVVIGDAAGHVHASSNGTSWSDWKPSGGFFINSILSLNGRFYANDALAGTFTSVNGANWQSISGTGQIFAGLFNGSSYYLFGFSGGSQGGVFTSSKTDGVNFTAQAKGSTMTVQQALFAENVYIQAGNDGMVVSTNGTQWKYAYGGEFAGVVYNGSNYIAAGKHGNDGFVMTSPDFINWTPVSLPLVPALKSIAYGGGKYVAVSDWPGSVMTSSDGVAWGAATAVDQDAGFSSVAYGNGVFVAVDEIGSIYRTANLANGWTQVRSDAVNYYSLHTVSYSNGSFYAVGDGGTILQSTDGSTWSDATSAPTAVSFNKFQVAQADISYALLNSSGFALAHVSSQGNLLQEGTDYTYDAARSTVTLRKSYLAGLDNGWHTFDFHLSNQVFERLAVNVTNTAPALPKDGLGVAIKPYESVATWNGISGAIGYDVQLYRNGSVWGGAVQLGAGARSYDFQAAFHAGGPADYKVRVKAKGDIVHAVDSPQSDDSNVRTIYKTPTEDGTADKANTTQHLNFNIVVNASSGTTATATKAGANVLRSATSVAESGGKATLPIDIAALAEGANDIVIALKNGAGNYSEASTVSLTRDTKPVGTAAAPATNEDTALNGTLGATVYDIDGTRTPTFAKASDPAHGTVTVNANGAYTYTPAGNFNGSDSFTFSVNDGTFSSVSPAEVSIAVNPVNDAPTAADATATTAEDTPLNGTLIGSDVDTGSTLTYAKGSDPEHGTLTVRANGTYTYTPSGDYTGSDSFTFTVSDGALTSAAAAVSLTVTEVNDAPIGLTASAATNEDTALAGTLTGTDVDTAGEELTFAQASNPTHGTLTVEESGAYTYTPEPNFNGSDSFTFTVYDGALTSAPATISITVNAVNDAPTATAASAATDEDTALSDRLTGADADAGTTLTFAKATEPAHGTLTVGADGAYTYTPDSGFNGNDSFTFTVSDGTLTSAPATVSIAVNAVNNAPTGDSASYSTDEDTALPGTLTGADVDTAAELLTFAKATEPAHGTLTVEANGAFTYTPAGNYNGSDSFTFTVNDGAVTSAPATISITVNALNDVPTAIAASATATEDTAVNGNLSGSDVETAAASLTYAKATEPAHGTLTVEEDGAYTYTPEPDYNGSDSFTFTVNDGEFTSAPATVSITVTGVNDAPTATAASATTDEDAALTGRLTGTDIDALTTLTFVKATEPAHGNVTVEADGAYTYTPEPSYSGSDSFTFTVSDGALTSAPATISITVNVVNDAPTATAATATATEDTAFSGNLSGTDEDTAAASLTFAKATEPAHGSLTVEEDGAYTYSPEPNYNGTDSFTFTVSDGVSTSAPATISITVTAVNDAPTATAASATTAEGTALSGQLTGTDIDGATALTFAKTTDPAHGTVMVDGATGAYTYTPEPGYSGSDSFTFTVSDGASTSAPATISITVNAVNAAPTATAASATTAVDTVLTGTLSGTAAAGASLTFAKATDPAHGAVTVDGATGAYTYTPEPGYSGSDSFTFTVSDGALTSAPATISIAVSVVNNALTATPASATTSEDTALTGTLSGTAAGAAPLTFAKATDPAHGAVTVDGATGAYTYTPEPGYSGSDSFTFTVSDGALTSAPATISITVNAVNAAPTATAASATTAVDTVLTGTLSGTAAAGASLTFAKATEPAHGVVTVDSATGAYTYTPESGYSGSDSFTFTVSDGALTSAPATISIAVSVVNNALTATPASATTSEDTALTGTLSGTAAGAAPLTFAKATDPAHGAVTVDSATGAYAYTPEPNYNGSDSFTFTVSDGATTSAPAAVSITVTAENDAPTATAASATTAEDTALTGTLAGTDPDAGTTLTFAKASEPAHGSLTVNETTGAYTYTPSPDYNGSDSFTFTVSDGILTSAAAAVSITVTPVSDSTGSTPPPTGSTPPPTGSTPPPTDNSQVLEDVLINGTIVKIGTSTTVQVDGRTVTTFVIDSEQLQALLASADLHAVVTIPVHTDSDVAIGELDGQTVQLMEQKQAVIKFETASGSYILPTPQIDIQSLSGQLGSTIELKDIKVQIEISKPSSAALELIKNAARDGEFTLVAPPLEFTVKAVYGDKSIEVSKFNAYVERTIALPDDVDPSAVTTAVVVDPDGNVRQVPTRIVLIDGKYYAQIDSLTNSTYAVIQHSVTFADVEHHWAKDAVNDMGSRMIISGDGNGMFSPDRNITRAEFAAIIVRGLGLKLEEGASPFSDVKAGDWYSSAVSTASAYKLISGFEDGTFHPSDNITREQAMAIIAKAMDMTGLRADGQTSSAEKALQAFADAGSVAAWARPSIADCLQAGMITGRTSATLAPKAFMTRAEVAAMVQRLLKKSELI